MAHQLECPGPPEDPAWDVLYLARADEIPAHRPIFTGDVFEDVPCHGLAEPRSRPVMIVHHPCALRSNGVDLQPLLQVHQVREQALTDAANWQGHFGKMPLPDVSPRQSNRKRHRVALFDQPGLVDTADLLPSKRIACLSQYGVDLLLQRWVHFTSRLLVPTFEFEKVTSPQFAEVELIEDWCQAALDIGIAVAEAATQAVDWLRGDSGTGVTWQELLKDPQQRSTVRRRMRAAWPRRPRTNS